MTSEDSTLSYLPLAHIFDRIVEEFALYSGARIGYYQVPAWDFWKAGCSSMFDSISRPQLAAAYCSLHMFRQTKCEAVMQATAQCSKSGLVPYVLETPQMTRLLLVAGQPEKDHGGCGSAAAVAFHRGAARAGAHPGRHRRQGALLATLCCIWQHQQAAFGSERTCLCQLVMLGRCCHRGRCLRLRVLLVWQVKGKGLLTRFIFSLAFRWKQFRIHMGAPVESVSPPTCAIL